MKDSADSPVHKVGAPNVFCRACDSPLVQAVEWEQQADAVWKVKLWCPECGFTQAATLDRPQLLYLSLAIEEGFVWMLEAVSELGAVPMEPGSLDFAHRAQTDRILPAGR